MEQSNLKDALAIRYIAHYKSNIKNGLFLHLEKQGQSSKDNKLIFPGANSIVVNALSSNFDSQKSQSFYHTVTGSKGITCMTQSNNKKLLAWAQETDSFPIITIIDLITGKKRMFATQIKAKKFVSLAFNTLENGESKLLVGLTNGPQYSLVQWSFDKNKFITNVIQKIEKIQRNDLLQKYTHVFFYKQQDLVVVIGQGVFKTIKLMSQKLQFKDSPFARKDISEKDFIFTSFAVLKDGLIVGTQSGDILYFTANCEFKLILPSSPGQGSTIQTLLFLPNSKSFLAGCGDGQLILYQKGDLRNIYTRSDRVLNLRQNKGKITSLTVTLKQDYIFVGLQPGVVLRSSIQKNQDWQFDIALQNYHTDSITGLDICLRKPLFATCSSDKTVKVWNFSERNNIEISKSFEQKASCLSFHPSGLHLAVCFPDKIRLISISNGDLSPYKQISTKSCYDVKFSNGGHLFAVANSVMVQIFNFWTYQQSPGHQFKCTTGKFTYISWQQDDLGVFLGTSDGYVFYNKLQDQSVRLQILSVPGFCVTSIYSLFSSKDQKQTIINERIVYISGIFNQATQKEDKCIFEVKINPRPQKDRQLSKQESKYIVSAPQKIFTSCNISNITMLNSHKLFFYTTEQKGIPGSLRYSRFPFNSSKQIAQLQSHIGRVTKLYVCYDDGLIFTGGQDGSLIVYQVRDKQIKIKLQILDSAQEFLYSKTQLKAQKTQLEQLKVRNNETRAKRDKIQKQQFIDRERLQREWAAKNRQRQHQQQQKLSKITKQKKLMQVQQVQRLALLDQEYKQKKSAVENDYKQKMLLQQTRKTQLAKSKQQNARIFNQTLSLIKTKHQEQQSRREEQLINEQKQQKAQKQRLEKQLIRIKAQHKQQQQQAEIDTQYDVKIKIQEQQDSFRKLEEQNIKASAESQAKKTALQQQIKSVSQENYQLHNTAEQLQRQKRVHQQLQQKKQSHAKQIQQRQKTIRDKVTRIQELKKKTQQLQKFKFVLDYKIKQLKKDIGPKQQQIAKMKDQIVNMNGQIIHFKKTGDNMRLIVKDLISKKNGMQKQLNIQTQNESANLQYIKAFEIDVSEMVQSSLQDFKQLKAKMLEIFRKYVQDGDDRKKVQSVDQQKQFIKERQHLESTSKSLRIKFATQMKLHKADNKRIMGQNQDLITQINDLRRQRKNMKYEEKKRNEQKQLVKRLEEEKLMLERQGEQLRKKQQTSKTQYEQALRRKANAMRD